MTTFTGVVSSGRTLINVSGRATGCLGICGRSLELWEEHDLSELSARAEAVVGLLHPLELERLCHGDRQPPGLEVREHLLLDQPHGRRLLLERARAERRAVDARALHHDQLKVDLRLRPG